MATLGVIASRWLPGTKGAIAAFCFFIAWAHGPYWLNGSASVLKQDLPYRVLGPFFFEFWRLPIVILYPFVLLATPFMLKQSVIYFRRRHYAEGALVALVIVAIAGAVAHSPHYYQWLMD